MARMGALLPNYSYARYNRDVRPENGTARSVLTENPAYKTAPDY